MAARPLMPFASSESQATRRMPTPRNHQNARISLVHSQWCILTKVPKDCQSIEKPLTFFEATPSFAR
ncbi:hypothetical protein GA0061078_0022 [Bifidobacterium bohemicum]|nr:hypothetical protein GA0061078_0022 [Bifidobacterium bohemicum]